VSVLHWNAFANAERIDLLTANPAAVSAVFDVAVGLLAAMQEVLPDLKAAGDGAVLITNGALGNAAKDKLTGLLAERLRDDGVYVGEVIIAGAINGTPTGNGQGIEGSSVADAFWTLYQNRSEVRARIS
jgi:hypothetical protein